MVGLQGVVVRLASIRGGMGRMGLRGRREFSGSKRSVGLINPIGPVGFVRRELGFELGQALQDVVAFAVVHAVFEDAAGCVEPHRRWVLVGEQAAQGVDGVGGGDAEQ
jgi:hypothetical protein